MTQNRKVQIRDLIYYVLFGEQSKQVNNKEIPIYFYQLVNFDTSGLIKSGYEGF